MKRREFLKGTATASISSCCAATLSALERETGTQKLERRSLGSTGEKLSLLGFGGIVVMEAAAKVAAQRVREAIEAGVNYFDVAPSYGDAEEVLGPVLEPYRKEVFLACKTMERDKTSAAEDLELSLQNLRTDHFDLYQHHGVSSLEEVEKILSPGGAHEAFLEARKAGKVRFLGFSAHSVEAALALMDAFAFDTILFPVNYVAWHAGSFGAQVLARAQEKKMGILAIKSLAKGLWPGAAKRIHPKCWYEPVSQPDEALMALRFTLSLPVTAVIPPGDENIFKMALGLAAKFSPLSQEEADAIKQKALKAIPLFKYTQKA